MKKIPALILICFFSSAFSWWPFSFGDTDSGNHHSQSFYAVKKEMLKHIYYDNRQTLYCNASFTSRKKIIKPRGFKLPDLQKADFTIYDITTEELARKAERMEWEHIVPAQNFGKTFDVWQKGHPNCTYGKGKKFKGRKCAEQESEDFRYMYTDMYNLYPSIGAVNFLRANFNLAQFSARQPATFGTCQMKISHNKAEPPDEVKGLIARTYFYMETNYPRYKISSAMREILQIWNKQFPITKWECVRAYRIEKLQGNANQIIKSQCVQSGWYNQYL